MKRALISVFFLAALGGCVGQEDVDGRSAALDDEGLQADVRLDAAVVPERAWRLADACGESLPSGRVHAVAGETGLGALVGRSGAVLCVDVLARFRDLDPVPTSLGDAEEPNPQPMSRRHGEEPNPQPMTRPTTKGEEPNPQPMLQLGVLGEEPNPQPMHTLIDSEEPNPQPM
ncbi:MAG: hypothetical protein RLO52_47770 [Sandaracinaceae bacterium]